jgi:hypothetical protein
MYNLGHKDYYSKADDRYIPISHMDFQHMVRAFVKLTEQKAGLEKQLNEEEDASDKLRKDVRFTDDVVENNDKIYKKNLQEQEDKILALSSKITNLLSTIEEKEESAEYWKNTYYNSQPKGCGYVFSEIPNDTDGQEFVDSMKKYFNRKTYKMRVRGQHIKPELKGTGATYWGQTRDESTHLRVYIETKRGD